MPGALAKGPALAPRALIPGLPPELLPVHPTPREGHAQKLRSRRTFWACSASPAWTSLFLPTQSQARFVTSSISDEFFKVTPCLKHDFNAPAALHCPNVLGKPLSLWTVLRFLPTGNPPSFPRLNKAHAGTSKACSSEKFCPPC